MKEYEAIENLGRGSVTESIKNISVTMVIHQNCGKFLPCVDLPRENPGSELHLSRTGNRCIC